MGRQGLAAVLLIFLARVLSGPCEHPRQESCQGNARYLGKEPCRGLGGILGKGACDCLVFWSSSSLVGSFVFTKICMSPWRCLLSLGSNMVDGVGTLGLKGGALCWRWASCPGKALAGAAEAAPARVLPGESTSPFCSPVFLVLALPWLSCALASLRLPSSALLSVAAARGSDCPCTSKGVKRRAPTFVHRQEPPGLGHT